MAPQTGTMVPQADTMASQAVTMVPQAGGRSFLMDERGGRPPGGTLGGDP